MRANYHFAASNGALRIRNSILSVLSEGPLFSRNTSDRRSQTRFVPCGMSDESGLVLVRSRERNMNYPLQHASVSTLQFDWLNGYRYSLAAEANPSPL
jgi:hypothetical protein